MKYFFLVVVTLFALSFMKAAYPSENTDRVKALFQAKCATCHGAIFNVLDVKDMTNKGIVQGGENSRLYNALNRVERWMPLGKDPLTIEEKQLVLTWLDAGYPAFDTGIPISGNIIDVNTYARCRAQDALANPNIAVDFRYIDIANYYKGVPDRLIEAVNKLLNSVSLVRPIAFTFVPCSGDPKAILRIDLRRVNQSRDAWDQILIDGNYPYAVDHRGINGLEEAVFYEGELARLTKARTISFVRGDWFIETASRDPVYSNLLFKNVRVNNIEDFELRFLRVNTFQQIFQTFEGRQAIFRRSGVTLYNRVVQSFLVDVGGFRGTYWKTFDVINDQANRNFFANPFGPLTVAYPFYDQNSVNFLKNRAFVNDASETIVNLDGIGQFYSLFDGKGRRIVEADTQIAVHHGNTTHPILGSDREGFTGKAGAILNGTSCFACHSGANSFVDDGRKTITLSPDFTNQQVDVYKRIAFGAQQEIDQYVGKSNASYASFQHDIGAKQVVYADFQEPIFSTAKIYLDDSDVCALGLELGLQCDDIKERLIRAPELARKLGLGEPLKGLASRLNIENFQAQIDSDLNLGRQIKFSGGVINPVCKVVIRNKSLFRQRLIRLVFGGASFADGYIDRGASKEFVQETDGELDGCWFYRPDRCVVQENIVLKKCTAYQIRSRSDGESFIEEAE